MSVNASRLEDVDSLLTRISLIFVHGLGSNPDTTWLSRNQSHPCAAPDIVDRVSCTLLHGTEHVNWVTDLFYHDLSPSLQINSRAFFYNYDSYWMRDGIEERRIRLGVELFESIVLMHSKVRLRFKIRSR